MVWKYATGLLRDSGGISSSNLVEPVEAETLVEIIVSTKEVVFLPLLVVLLTG